MKATAQIKKMDSSTCKHLVIRNLSRIMDIRILAIDTDKSTVSFLYDSKLALEKVIRELFRIGYPILNCIYQDQNGLRDQNDYGAHVIGL